LQIHLTGGTISREDFTFDKERDVFICPAGKVLAATGNPVNGGETLLYVASRRDCRNWPAKTAMLSKYAGAENSA
jgi:hypothetical protein